MALTLIPPPLQHPVIGANGMVTVPWAAYFRSLAVAVDDGGYMLRSVYDPANSGVVDNSEALSGQAAAYYLALANATGTLPVSQTRWNVRQVTAAATAVHGDMMDANANASAFSVTLPPVSGSAGNVVIVRKSDASANAVTVAAAGSDTINGASTKSLASQYDKAVLLCTGNEWAVV